MAEEKARERRRIFLKGNFVGGTQLLGREQF